MKLITGKNLKETGKQKSQKPQNIARICEQDSWRKVLRSFTHSSTQ